MWNKENLLKMEIERDLRETALRTRILWNKENLLKMEIESSLCTSRALRELAQETKKISWKWRLKVYLIPSFQEYRFLRNKENLLKMEIERQITHLKYRFLDMGNKENLLKMEIESAQLLNHVRIALRETKKISWKWRLKVTSLKIYNNSSSVMKQRKSPENGDWKLQVIIEAVRLRYSKQRKSPENGDWKWC